MIRILLAVLLLAASSIASATDFGIVVLQGDQPTTVTAGMIYTAIAKSDTADKSMAPEFFQSLSQRVLSNPEISDANKLLLSRAVSDAAASISANMRVAEEYRRRAEAEIKSFALQINNGTWESQGYYYNPPEIDSSTRSAVMEAIAEEALSRQIPPE